MASLVKQRAPAVTSIFVLLANIVTAPELDMDLVFINCANDEYGDLEDFALAVTLATSDILHHTGPQGGNWYNRATVGSASCYAHGRCAMDITPQQCGECLEGVHVFTLQKCKSKGGVHCKVGSCEFRYEKYAFNDG